MKKIFRCLGLSKYQYNCNNDYMQERILKSNKILKGGNATIFINNNKKSIIKLQDNHIDAKFELELLQKFNNSNYTPNYYKHYLDNINNKLLIEMEYFKEGDLFEYLRNKKKIKKKELIINILENIKFLHNNNIQHLDLKPENFVIKNDLKNELCIIDFGSAHYLEHNKKYLELKRTVGTELYTSPEIIEKNIITKTTDIWSLGILFYIIETKSHIFDSYIKRKKFNDIYNENNINKKIILNVKNEDLIDLLSKMIEINENKRYDLNKVLNHKYIKDMI